MTKRSWMVVGLLGLGTAIFFVIVGGVFRNVGVGVSVMPGYDSAEMVVSKRAGMPMPGTTSQLVAEDMGMIEPDYLPPRYPGGDALDELDRDYEYFSNYEVVANNVTEYMSNLKAYVLTIDGRVLNSSMSSRDKMSYGSLTIKVPVASFDATNNQITSNADEVMSETVHAADVTGTTVSLTERKQKLEEDKLSLQEELDVAKTDAEKRRLELQIERLENQLESVTRQMENQEERVSYATVSVQVANDSDYFDPRGRYTEPDLSDQVEMAWEALWYMLQKLIVLAIWVGVFAVLWLPVVLLVVWLKKRRKKSEGVE